MPTLTSDMFIDFFRELHSFGTQIIEPFPWQIKLAQRACSGQWPHYIAAPTGSGKTAAIDAAVFALAVQSELKPEQRTIGRRIFYIVNRRVIVDEAFERAQKIVTALASPSEKQPTVKLVAEALRLLTKDPLPLESIQLRGGIYRDQSWARSVTQPLVICSTVDQVGSRLLFRGYGVSPSSWPIHAALVANDSLLLLDEAHISRPFVETLTALKRYRALGAGRPHEPGKPSLESPETSFAFVQMTATPPANATKNQILSLDQADYQNPILEARLTASKPAMLVVAEKATGKKASSEIVKKLCDETIRILTPAPGLHSIAILVNRVATARDVFEKLSEKFGHECVSLLIGRMRPLDRDDLTRDLSVRLRTKVFANQKFDPDFQPQQQNLSACLPRIVVATQCLEVGADFDFDVIVTECASLDSLRQRFGRLNRAGRSISVQAAVVIRADQIFEGKKLDDPKNYDPIYGGSLARTWKWLSEVARDGVVDFGIDAMNALVENLRRHNEKEFSGLLSPTQKAPLLLPAYLDVWCQTSPETTPQPEPAIFLHGVKRTDADVQVCWRDDLGENPSLWADILSLCPPSALECLNVPISQFYQWLRGETASDTGDILDAVQSEVMEKTGSSLIAEAIVWRGPDSSIQLKTKGDLKFLRPGDTIVLASRMDQAFTIGHIPGIQKNFVSDQAHRAWLISKQKKILRLSPSLLQNTKEFRNHLDRDSSLSLLLEYAQSSENDISVKSLPKILHLAAREAQENVQTPDTLKEILKEFSFFPAKRIRVDRYPGTTGLVIQTAINNVVIPTDDSGDDATSDAFHPVSLDVHLADTGDSVKSTLELIPLAKWAECLILAAKMHDCGKIDERFQALLAGGNINHAWAMAEPLAKSPKMPASASAYEKIRKQANLPIHFRHEFLSVQLAEKAGIAEDLTLHLIAAHHGYARPFAPVVFDDNPPEVSIVWDRTKIALSKDERIALPSYRLDSGIAERFWRLTRRFGWWNLAYLETVVRLADRQVSASYQ